MRAKLVREIYEIWNPEEEKVEGYRWRLRGKRVDICSPIYSTQQAAETGCERFIHSNLSNVTIKHDRKLKLTSNSEFLI